MSLQALIRLGLQGVGVLLLVLTLPLTLELLVLTSAACLPPLRPKRRLTERQKLAVVVPARDQAKVITGCIRSLFADRDLWLEVYVVAHGCTDHTAEFAAEAGARILTLLEPGTRQAALEHGIRRALLCGADGVLVIDADSVVSGNLVSAVAEALAGGADAVQLRCEAGKATSTLHGRLAKLALIGTSVVRPRGRSRLGLSCGILDHGFALSARTLTLVPYSAKSLNGGLDYHLRLLTAGLRVDFLDHATVWNDRAESSAEVARERRLTGRDRVLLRRTHALPLLSAILRGNLRLFEPFLEVTSRPPGSQVLLLIAMLAMPLCWTRIYAGSSVVMGFIYFLTTACLSRPGHRG